MSLLQFDDGDGFIVATVLSFMYGLIGEGIEDEVDVEEEFVNDDEDFWYLRYGL